MFKTFGEYMYALLFSPLRRGRQSLNQFYIFFKVMGRSFDCLLYTSPSPRDS